MKKLSSRLNILARLFHAAGTRQFSLRGAYGQNVTQAPISNEAPIYWGDFHIVDVGRLEWVKRRPRGFTGPDCELIVDNTGNRFWDAVHEYVWGFAELHVWVGRGDNFDTGYFKQPRTTSPSMLWSGRVFHEGGIVRLEGNRAAIRASNNPFLFDPGVLLNTSASFVEDEDGFDRWIPLVLGDWQTSDVRAADAIPCIRTGSGNGGGTWTVGLGPLEGIDSVHKAGADPTSRDDADSFDSVELTSYATRNATAGTVALDARVSGAQLTYTPQGLWARCGGLKTTAAQSLVTLANDEMIDRARDQAVFLLQRRAQSFGGPIDANSFSALADYKGRRCILNQRSVQGLFEELEHDLAFSVVNLSGARGGTFATGGNGRGNNPGQVAVKLGQGRLLSDWDASRYLIASTLHDQRGRQLGYRNVDLAQYNWIASSEGRSSAKGYRVDIAAAELVRFGFIIVGLHLFRWLYNRLDVQAIQTIYLNHFGHWPIEAVRFNATLDYLDILPTDRLVLEAGDRTATHTRYTHVEQVALDWEHQLLRVEGYKSAPVANPTG